MKTTTVSFEDLRGVFAVPPLARRQDANRTIDFDENNRLVQHLKSGGVTRLLYGGNAFLYHITLSEYEQLIEWLAGFSDELWAIPSFGPSYGRAMDQAPLLRRHNFPCAMMLPCGDPRDARGLEQGYREIADAAATPLVVYLKEENNFGADRLAGLDAVARLVDAKVCVAIKYAVVRVDPAEDAYLEELLKRVDRRLVISGIGERPAVVHLREWRLPGFTTGSGCIAPHLSNAIFNRCVTEDYVVAETMRTEFLPLEDMRDAEGPARVLHHAAELTGLMKAGAVPPYISPLAPNQMEKLATTAQTLLQVNKRNAI